PVKIGLVASMNRPGANITGLTLLTTSIDGKRIGLLKELVPKASLIAALINPDFPPAENPQQDILQAASDAGAPRWLRPEQKATSSQRLQACSINTLTR